MNKILFVLIIGLAALSACRKKIGYVSTFAGSGKAGADNGGGLAASFSNLMAIAADSSGNLYVADSRNNLVRKVSENGDVTTLAGSGKTGSDDGNSTAASFFFPAAIAADAKGTVYLADTHNNMIRRISPDGKVTTIAGRISEAVARHRDTVIKLENPYGIAVDAAGNVYIADWERDMIKKLSPGGKMSVVAGSGEKGSKDGRGPAASFYLPEGLALDQKGNLYVADCYNNMIRKIDPTGVVTTLAGNEKKGAKDGKGKAASFNHPDGLAVDKHGNVYVADVGNNKIRKVSPDGTVSTLAGTGVRGAADGPAAKATFYRPFGLAIGKDGDLFVADYQNNVIRRINL